MSLKLLASVIEEQNEKRAEASKEIRFSAVNLYHLLRQVARQHLLDGMTDDEVVKWCEQFGAEFPILLDSMMRHRQATLLRDNANAEMERTVLA